MKFKPNLLIISTNVDELAFLRDFGYDVKFISSGNEAIELLRFTSDKYSLIVIEILSSFTRGWEILKFLRSHHLFESVPILVISDLKEKTDELLALRSGADDFILKPFDLDIFLARLDVALRRSMWNKLTYIDLNQLPFIKIPSDSVKLTIREETVLNLLSLGYANEEISIKLHLSKLTVKTHIKNIYKKLNVNNRTEATLVGIKLGLIKT